MQKFKKSAVYRYRYLYAMALPLLIYYFVFMYLPMYGIVLSFKEYNFSSGIAGSPWVGIENFKTVFKFSEFRQAFRNTIIISLGRLLIEFPVPILFALLVNEITHARLKKVYQTVATFPHFLSWIILAGILTNLLSDSGVVNQFLVVTGAEKNDLLLNTAKFRGLLYISNIWREMGWQSIIYLAAISGIDPSLYEAAKADGANRLQQMRTITLPCIMSTAIILFILAVGQTMSSGAGSFDQIFNLYNPVVYPVADIIDTYIYRRTFVGGVNFGISTAVGLVKSVINFVLVYGTNYIVKKMGQEGMV